MTTVATNHEAGKKDEKKSESKPASLADQAAAHLASPGTTVAPERAPKAKGAKLDASEAVRLMLTTLKRVEPTDRPKVLATLAALA